VVGDNYGIVYGGGFRDTHTRIWGIQHSKKNLYNVDAFINFCHVYFLCICLLSPFILVPQIAGLFQATDPSRQA